MTVSQFKVRPTTALPPDRACAFVPLRLNAWFIALWTDTIDLLFDGHLKCGLGVVVTGSVNVISPVGRAVYINGNYTPNFPRTIPYRFTVEDGSNIFETRTANGVVDYRGKVTTDSDDQDLALKKLRKPRTTG